MRILLPARSPWTLAAADAAAVALFATVGLLSHRGGVSATGYARDLLPVLGGWLAAAAALGTYRQRSLPRLLATWIAGVTAGIVVRAAVLGRSLDGKEAAFLGVALAFTLLFVVAVRAALALAPPRRA